jgi:MFS family permease
MAADRWGARPTMVLSLVACSMTTALNGLVHGYAALLAVRALFAVSIAAIPGVTMKMLAERVRPDRRLTANGIMFGTTLAGALWRCALLTGGWISWGTASRAGCRRI